MPALGPGLSTLGARMEALAPPRAPHVPVPMPTDAGGIVDTLYKAGTDNQVKNDYFGSFGLHGSGRNEAASGLKLLSPLEYGLVAHQYGLASELQPHVQQAIRDLVAELQNPDAMNLALRNGLLSRVPETAGTAIAGLTSYGAGDSAKEGAYLTATNQANEAANTAEARAASPEGKLQRLQAIQQIIQSAMPDLTRILAMSGNLASLPQQPNFLGGLASGVVKSLPYLAA